MICLGYTNEKMTKADYVDISKLWVTALVVGVLWQPETDIACWIADTDRGFNVN